MKKKALYIIIGIVLIAILCVGGYFLMKNKDEMPTTSISSDVANNIKNEKISSENYEEISKRITEELGDTEDTYCFSYACVYYVMKDGLTQEYMTTQDESLLYKNIYNKTVQNLIDEGKQLMEENNITVEQYKQQLEKIDNNLINND